MVILIAFLLTACAPQPTQCHYHAWDDADVSTQHRCEGEYPAYPPVQPEAKLWEGED